MFKNKGYEIVVKSDDEKYCWEPNNKQEMLQCIELYRQKRRREKFMNFTESTFLMEF